MRLTCHDCGTTVYISAEAPNCPECRAELESYLRALEYVRECYQQASVETLAGDHERALAILAQGLSAVNASELHLLAALIHRKQGEYDGMHRHVAAIPVDDPLRPEGEWLLRSHQQKQRAVRQAQKEYTPPAHPGKAARQLSPEFYAAPPTLQSPLRPPRISTRRVGRLVTGLLVVVMAALLLRQPLTNGLALLTADPTAAVTTGTKSNAAAIGPTLLPVLAATPTSEPTPAPTALPTALPTVLPTATLPVPVAAAPPAEEAPPPAEPPAIAALNDALAAAVATSEANRFDLADYLTRAERADLAVLPISATLENGRLVLSGVVTLTYLRLELLASVAEMPGVTEVDAINLVVRLPEVYVVGDGDTLWTIAYYLYGDGSRWEELYAANAKLLGNTVLLALGMELEVPDR